MELSRRPGHLERRVLSAEGGAGRGFDELEFYARWFDVVEVNSTFYGQPRPQVTAKWAERTPPGFEFAVKLYQKFTHPAMFREAAAEAAPEADADWLDQAGTCGKPTSTSSGPGSTRWPTPASWARCSCSSRRASP